MRRINHVQQTWRVLVALGTTALAAPAPAAWYEASSAHFVVYADAKPDEVRDYATRLERFDRGMRIIRGVADRPVGQANRVTVYIVPDADVASMAGSGIAGFYVARAGETLAVTILDERVKHTDFDTRFTTLFHEYTHHFLYANWPDAAYPMWFSEGYAELAGTAQFAPDGALLFGVPNAYSLHLVEAIYGQPMGVSSMVASNFTKLSSDALYMTYARGWLLTHYLQFEPSRKGQLTRYLALINTGTPAAQAARTAFGDLAVLEREVDRYRSRRTFPQLSLKPGALTITPVELRPLDAGEAATIRLRARVKNSGKRTAGQLAAAVRRAAQDYPGNVAAQTVLAEAEFDAGNHDAAEGAADRALAVDPKALEAMLYKGRARMARAAAAKTTDPAVWKDVRRWFLNANRLDPDDPRPLILYYRSFGAAGIAPTPSAVGGLAYAFGLAPQDRRLRLMVARQQVSEGKAAEAITSLRPLAYSPHGDQLTLFAQDVIATLSRGDIKAALARWAGASEMIREASGLDATT